MPVPRANTVFSRAACKSCDVQSYAFECWSVVAMSAMQRAAAVGEASELSYSTTVAALSRSASDEQPVNRGDNQQFVCSAVAMLNRHQSILQSAFSMSAAVPIDSQELHMSQPLLI